MKRAIRSYYERRGLKPGWLPEQLTVEEKQTLEEEEMMERYRKTIKNLEGGER